MRSGSGCGACGSNAAEVLAPKAARRRRPAGRAVEALEPLGGGRRAVTDGGTNGGGRVGRSCVGLGGIGLSSSWRWSSEGAGGALGREGVDAAGPATGRAEGADTARRAGRASEASAAGERWRSSRAAVPRTSRGTPRTGARADGHARPTLRIRAARHVRSAFSRCPSYAPAFLIGSVGGNMNDLDGLVSASPASVAGLLRERRSALHGDCQ